MDSKKGRRDEPRKILSVPGRIRTGRGVPHHVTITDLSEGGCRAIELSSRIKEGSTVSIRIGRLDPIYARVCWREKRDIGLEFQRPIYGPVFENIKAILADVDDKKERRAWMRYV